MATTTSRRAVRAKPAPIKKTTRAVTTARARPAAHRRRKTTQGHRAPAKQPVSTAATAVLKRFAKLLKSVRAAAASLTDEQRAVLKRAMKHAHAALD